MLLKIWKQILLPKVGQTVRDDPHFTRPLEHCRSIFVNENESFSRSSLQRAGEKIPANFDNARSNRHDRI
jgi:hypothetical protein